MPPVKGFSAEEEIRLTEWILGVAATAVRLSFAIE